MTLVTIKAPEPPKIAHALAEEHQISHAAKIAKSKPPKHKIAIEAPPEKVRKVTVEIPEPPQPIKALKPAKPLKPTKHETPVKDEEPAPVKEPVAPKVMAHKAIEKPKFVVKRVEAEVSPPEPTPRPQISPELLQQQIAQLGVQMSRHEQPEDAPSRIKSSSSVNTYKYVAAQYTQDVTKKIQGIGELNIPKMTHDESFQLTMDIGIKANGSVYSVIIRKSSGNPVIDKAAKKIVRMSAPFPPLPKALLNQLDVLVITRVWNFSDETGMTAH